jgi:uncharacterized protein YfaS (alpha-2-macroglobulin family)
MVVFSGAFAGQFSYGYTARAVTIGTYVFPAISAGCMYDPEVRSVNGKMAIRVE